MVDSAIETQYDVHYDFGRLRIIGYEVRRTIGGARTGIIGLLILLALGAGIDHLFFALYLRTLIDEVLLRTITTIGFTLNLLHNDQA